jgi:hypothetical protein
MIPAGLVNSLVAWATGSAERIAQLTRERDALVEKFLSGKGKASTTVTTASTNGKSVTALQNLSPEEKLGVLTAVLEELGEAPAPAPSVIYANFRGLTR